jgi:hypothetical protein
MTPLIAKITPKDKLQSVDAIPQVVMILDFDFAQRAILVGYPDGGILDVLRIDEWRIEPDIKSRSILGIPPGMPH